MSNEPEPITRKDIPILPIPLAPQPGDISGTTEKLNIFGGGADPITAGFNAAAAFFNFLSTPQGQRVCSDMLTIDEFLVKKIYEIFVKIHGFLEKKA